MTLYGFDVSSAQRGLDVGTLPADYVIIKCTGGIGYLNPFFQQQLASAKSAGMRTALYHYAGDYNPGSAAQEAEWYLQNALPYLDGTVIPILDWEEGGNPNVDNDSYALEFCNRVRDSSGINPMAYADMAHIFHLAPCYNSGVPIWVAAYTLGYTRIDGYTVPQGPIGNTYGIVPVMWQFTSSGYLPGWDRGLDLNIFYGDGAAWDQLAAKNGIIIPQGDTTGDEMTPEQMYELKVWTQTVANENADRVINDNREKITAAKIEILQAVAKVSPVIGNFSVSGTLAITDEQNTS